MDIRKAIRWYLRLPGRRLLQRKLAGRTGYDFTTDYVSDNAENWRQALGGLAGQPGVRMLEIGCFEGRSAVWFLDHILTEPSARLFCLDIFSRDRYNLRFDHNIGRNSGAHKVTKLTGESVSLLGGLERGSFDAVYVDGSHDALNVLWDAVASWRVLKEEGVLIFDDYLWQPERPAAERPQLAIESFLELLEGEYEVLFHGYQVAIRKRTACG